MTIRFRQGLGYGTAPQVLSPPLRPGVPTASSGPSIVAAPTSTTSATWTVATQPVIRSAPLRTTVPTTSTTRTPSSRATFAPDPLQRYMPGAALPGPRARVAASTTHTPADLPAESAAVASRKGTQEGGSASPDMSTSGGNEAPSEALPPVPTTDRVEQSSSLSSSALGLVRRYSWWIVGGVGVFLLTRWFFRR